jgi:pimeloyl-ACP methyl ester carboxylesterase
MGGALSVEQAEAWLASRDAARSVDIVATVVNPPPSAIENAFRRVAYWAHSDSQTPPVSRVQATVTWSEAGAVGEADAPVLIFLAGIGGCRYVAKLFGPAASRAGVRVISIDPPGIGGSTGTSTFGNMFTTVAAWREIMCAFVEHVIDGTAGDAAAADVRVEDVGRRTANRTPCNACAAFVRSGAARDNGAGQVVAAAAPSRCPHHRRVCLGGFSAGGLLTMIAASDPWLSQRIDSVTLVGPWMPPSWPGAALRARLGGYVPGPVLSLMSGMIPMSTRMALGNVKTKRLESVLGVESGTIDDGWSRLFGATVQEASRSGEGGFGELLNLCLERREIVGVDDVPRSISAPSTLILAGEQDAMVPPDALQVLSQLIAGSQLEVVPKYNHDALGGLCADRVIEHVVATTCAQTKIQK